jgi:hypothetical protein
LKKELKMKKLLAIVLAVIMVLAITVPAVAGTGVGTGVTVSGSSGMEPFIKAKWETNDAVPDKPGTQILPVPGFGNVTPICFCVVVYDNPIFDVKTVSVDVYHPSGYPLEGSFKFEVVLSPFGDALADKLITEAEVDEAVAYFTAAYNAGLVTFNTDPIPGTDPPIVPTKEEVIHEITEGEAWIWCGCYWMYYHQPAGMYKVDAFAIDTGMVAPESHLINYFEYLPVTACEFDFTSISYGSTTADGFVSGDSTWQVNGDNRPTMRNIGNTWCQVEIQQDDMGFGKSTSGWNVQYDARVGSITEYPQGGSGASTWFWPAVAKGTAASPTGWTTLPGVVHLCNTWKMDFSIHIIKGTDPAYNGTMWLRCVSVPFTGANIAHPGTILPAPVPATPPSPCPPLVATRG